MGITFKEDCPDIRNSRVIDIYKELLQFGINEDVFDPYAGKQEVKEKCGIDLINELSDKYDAIILAVSHSEFLALDFKQLSNSYNSVLFDTKSFLNRSIVFARL